jgi:hypothetical protein
MPPLTVHPENSRRCEGDAAGPPVGSIDRHFCAEDRVLAEDGHFAERLKILPREPLRIEDPVLVALGVATFDRGLFEHGRT